MAWTPAIGTYLVGSTAPAAWADWKAETIWSVVAASFWPAAIAIFCGRQWRLDGRGDRLTLRPFVRTGGNGDRRRAGQAAS